MEKIDISADTLSILKRRQNINKYNHEFSVYNKDNLRI